MYAPIQLSWVSTVILAVLVLVTLLDVAGIGSTLPSFANDGDLSSSLMSLFRYNENKSPLRGGDRHLVSSSAPATVEDTRFDSSTSQPRRLSFFRTFMEIVLRFRNRDRESSCVRDCSPGSTETEGSSDESSDIEQLATTDSTQLVPTTGQQPGCNVVDGNTFNICLDLQSISGEYETWMNGFTAAAAKWESMITNDLKFVAGASPSLSGDVAEEVYSNGCGEYPENLDDIFICAKDEDIDGPSGTLGYAFIGGKVRRDDEDPARGSVVMPLVGEMRFDTSDIPRFVASGQFDGIILHEIAHVLGVGSLWEDNNLVSIRNVGSGEIGTTVEASYVDQLGGYQTKAVQEWNALGCSGDLPIESDFGPGTAYVHWDETCFQNELMSGFQNNPSPISKVTLGSLDDMGYAIDYDQADSFTSADLRASCCPASVQNMFVPDQIPLPPRLSPSGQAAVMSFAAEKLTEFRANTPPSNNVPGELSYSAGDAIYVLYTENEQILDMLVTWDMVSD